MDGYTVCDFSGESCIERVYCRYDDGDIWMFYWARIKERTGEFVLIELALIVWLSSILP